MQPALGMFPGTRRRSACVAACAPVVPRDAEKVREREAAVGLGGPPDRGLLTRHSFLASEEVSPNRNQSPKLAVACLSGTL